MAKLILRIICEWKLAIRFIYYQSLILIKDMSKKSNHY